MVSTSHAIDGAVDPRRDVDLEGVLMPMAPWFMNDTAQAQARRNAEQMYSNLNVATLSHLYAMGLDLMALMRWLEPLQADSDLTLPGMTGQLRVAPSGQIVRRLPWVKIERGQAQPVSLP